jgi:hypothetical protein
VRFSAPVIRFSKTEITGALKRTLQERKKNPADDNVSPAG